MRVVHLSHSDSFGGAANFALRIIDSLNSIEVDNTFLVSSKIGRLSNTHVVSPQGNNLLNFVKAKISQISDRQIRKLEKTEIPMDKSPNLFGAINASTLNKYDCVHFHYINGGLISISQIGKISKPILWTMPDMWPFLGGEHYLTHTDNVRFLSGYLNSNRNKLDLGIDISKYIYKQKVNNFKDLNLVAPSSWLANQAKKSFLFKNKSIEVIPPPIDFQIFKPIGSLRFRKFHSIDEDDFVIGFLGGTQIRKGWKFVYDLILYGLNEDKWKFILGGVGRSKYPSLPSSVIILGTVNSQEEMLEFYSSIDVLLVPSIQEAFGLVAQEAQSCGVPVIVFSETGCSEIVKDSYSGFVVKNRSVNDLVKPLEFLHNLSKVQRINMSADIRLRSQKLWDKSNIAEKYREKYREIISSSENFKKEGA